MKLEDQVCSLDLAKRLKELGVKQESLFYWDYHHFANPDKEFGWIIGCDRYHRHTPQESISAFTVAELGEMLPMAIKKDWEAEPIYFSTYRQTHGWRVSYLTKPGQGKQIEAGTEANARAMMLAYLIEQGLVKP